MCQHATQKYQGLFTKPGTHLFGTPNLTYMRRSFKFSPIGERADEEKALKSEVAEIKKILSDGSASESCSNGKFIVTFNIGISLGSKNHHQKLCSSQ